MEPDALIKEFEGCRLTAYQDGGGVWTVGWGSTGRDIAKGTSWTQKQADADLARRVTALSAQVRTICVRQLNSNQLAALVSLAYNIGFENFQKSRLLVCVQASKDLAAAREFIAWDHDQGIEVKGLLRRRLREAFVYLS